MNYELRRGNRRTIAIEVRKDLSVIVRAPKFVSVSEINKFVGEKADWIDKNLNDCMYTYQRRLF